MLVNLVHKKYANNFIWKISTFLEILYSILYVSESSYFIVQVTGENNNFSSPNFQCNVFINLVHNKHAYYFSSKNKQFTGKNFQYNLCFRIKLMHLSRRNNNFRISIFQCNMSVNLVHKKNANSTVSKISNLL